MTSTSEHGPVVHAARRLRDAARDVTACPPVRDLIGADDIDVAYAVQRHLTEERLRGGARVVGHKIGLTAPAVQAQLGVDRPDFGVLFDDMDVSALALVPTGRLLQPRIEAEVAFVLGADLHDGDLGPAQVRDAVEYLVPALEIVDSRIAGWDIRIADTIADNASSGLFVLGTTSVTLSTVEPVDTVMEMVVDGEVVSKGSGKACLGDPLAALAWLARAARDLGDPLRAGQVVLSGALGPMVPVRPGMRVTATLSGIGEVATAFAPAADDGARGVR
ncbi:putative hydratase/decarboxylase [Virgisporangium aliadipatigenens]|uniref:Putative hydratase/decarboxylase n=1 Tax=Virgisporangium aliadipatigenens TaxID=741659 RepID=A0A8J3YK37_9ACTN|nr:fumarylacetoacetate hydrolase family protein [Virgisporangium aliadipatigenens]GIJ45405.1 putative hydratase/decarboxylase [Virgisporangium aliadipatigenens]